MKNTIFDVPALTMTWVLTEVAQESRMTHEQVVSLFLQDGIVQTFLAHDKRDLAGAAVMVRNCVEEIVRRQLKPRAR